MTRILIILMTFFTFGCHINGQTDKLAQIKEFEKLAQVSDSLQDLKSSIKYYTQILEIDSTNLLARINRGRALVWAGEVEKGLSDYNKAVEIFPHERTYYTRGMAYVKLNHFDKALPDLMRSLKLNPNFGEGYYGLSYALENQGKLDSALLLCAKAEKLSCPIGLVHNQRYSLYKKMGMHDSAIIELTKLIILDASNPVYFNNRGVEKNEIKNYNEAIKDFDEALKLDSNMAYAYNNKAEALLRLHRLSQALNEVNKSLRINGGNAFAFKNRGEIYLAFNLNDDACDDFTKSSKLSNDNQLSKDLNDLEQQYCKK